MAAVADHPSRCFMCSTSTRQGIGAITYFSFSRGGWWRVPLCRTCTKWIREMCDARRRGAA